MNKRRKSVGRRRSRSLVGFASKDLCETIPKSLLPSERLLMLIERSYQYALSSVQKDFIENEEFNISSFRKEGANCWEKLKVDIEDLCKSAVTDDTLTNQSLLTVKTGEYEKSKLEAESAKWSEQIQNYRKALAKEIDSPCTVDASEWKEKNMLYDYSDIIQYSSSTYDKMTKQVRKLSETETTVSKCLKYSNYYKRRCSKRIRLMEHREKESAKTVIMNAKFASINGIPKHCRYS